MRKLLFTIVGIACCVMITRFCKQQTHGFTLARVSSDLPFNPAWEVPLPMDSTALQQLLEGPYTFLAKGAQCFVFASQDGQRVLKLLKHHHMRPRWWQRLGTGCCSAQRLHAKLAKDCASYHLAYTHLKEETGLLYLHLNTTLHPLIVDLVDPLGIHHTLNLNHYTFILQERASPFYPTLQGWIDHGRIDEAKKALSSLVHLLSTRPARHIYDKDPDLNTNFGFIGTRSVQIDIGRLRYANDRTINPLQITDHLHQWLALRSPELDHHLMQTLQECQPCKTG